MVKVRGGGGGEELIYFMGRTRRNGGEVVRNKLAMGRNLHKSYIVLNPESINDSWVDFFIFFTSQSARWLEFEAKILDDVSLKNSMLVSSFLWCSKAAWRDTEGSCWTRLNTPSRTWDAWQL